MRETSKEVSYSVKYTKDSLIVVCLSFPGISITPASQKCGAVVALLKSV